MTEHDEGELGERDEGNISGASVLGQLQAMEAALGPANYAQTLARLSAQDRAALEGLTAVGWVPIALSTRLLRAGAAVAGRDYGEFLEAIARVSSTHNYKTLWRVLTTLTSDDEALIARAGALVHRVYDRGAVSARRLGPGRAELLVTQWPGMPERALRGTRVAIEVVAELSKRKDVRAVATRTPDGARYELSWRA